MAAKAYYSLTGKNILDKAKTYTTLKDELSTLLKNGPKKEAGLIADRDWKGGKDPWMIKVSEDTMPYIIRTTKAALVKELGGGKERIYEYPGKVVSGKATPVQVKFRATSKVAPTAAGTEEQEKGSAYIFDRAVNNKAAAGYKSYKDLYADTEAYDELVKIFRGDVPESWLISYFAQQKVLLEKVQPPSMCKFDHSGTGSFMEFITKLCLDNFDTDLGLGGKKDSWNPADIWIVKKSDMAKIKKELQESVTTIHELNDTLRRMYHDKRVIGVSLKKTGKVAYYEEVNLEKDGLITDTKMANFPVTMKGFTSNFLIKTGDDMFTQDVKINVEGGGATYVFQIKANSSDAKGGSNLKFEPTKKGSGSARLGKAPVDMVTKILKKDFKRTFVNDHNLYPKNLDEFKNHPKKDEKYFRKVLTKLLQVGMDTDVTNVDQAINNIKQSFAGKKDRGTNTKAKLMGLDFFYECAHLTPEDLREFVTDMCYLAQKKAFKKVDYFGPFGKIY